MLTSSNVSAKAFGLSIQGTLKGASIRASSNLPSSLKGNCRGLQRKGINFHRYNRYEQSPFALASRAASSKARVGGVGGVGAPETDGVRSSSSISRSSSSSSMSSSEATKGQKAKEGFKDLWKKYGTVAITTYLSVYISTLTGVFLALDYDIFGASTFGMDPVESINKVADIVEGFTGSTAFPGYVKENPRVGTFAVAWIMTKFTEPARLFFTIGIVPSIARTLGYAPPKAKKKAKDGGTKQ